ncbi:hypothetical protein ACFY4B_14655 [Kitasatospora sp. NPDC001261]|uniref:hypothetical protein n=1 Tax=Kitasatospora sp. NPDC001261 TaxID=3364012 RepID=UPI003683F1D3
MASLGAAVAIVLGGGLLAVKYATSTGSAGSTPSAQHPEPPPAAVAGEQCAAESPGDAAGSTIRVCFRRAGNTVYMVAYAKADPATSADVYLWLKDGSGTAAVYPANGQAVSWTGVPLESSAEVRKETPVNQSLVRGTTYNVSLAVKPAGGPAPNIRNHAVDGRQIQFTY